MNARDTGEFVVNIVTESIAERMNLTAKRYPPEIDEFEIAGLTPVTSAIVRAPRVLESPDQYGMQSDADYRAQPGS